MWKIMGNIATRSMEGSDLYTFVTAGEWQRFGGWAWQNSLCGPKFRSVNINRYQGNALITARARIEKISIFDKLFDLAQ